MAAKVSSSASETEIAFAAGGCAPGASGNRCANATGAAARAAASNIVTIEVLILAFSCLAILETRLESCMNQAPLGGLRSAAAREGATSVPLFERVAHRGRAAHGRGRRRRREAAPPL